MASRFPPFLLVAVLTGLVYGVTAWFYNQPALTDVRLYRELYTWGLVLSLCGLYGWGYRQVCSELPAWKPLIMATLGLAVLALLVPNFHSTDLFGYINRGWQQVGYGVNPYVLTVDDLPGWERDPMITDHWVNNPSPYGFLYLQIARVLTMLGGGHLATTVWVFKAFNALLYAGIAAMIADVARRQYTDASARRAFYLFAWNPLILLHALTNGHNDIVMGFFVALAAYCAWRNAWIFIIPALVAATFIKYGAVVILPFAAVFLIRQRAWAALIGGCVLGLAVFLAAGSSYLPDWQEFRLEKIERNAFVTHSSLHAMLYHAYETVADLLWPVLLAYKDAVRSVLKNALLLTYAGVYAILLWRAWRTPAYSVTAWTRDALMIMAVLVVLISLKFYPWYLGMFFPLAFFLPEGNWLRRFLIVLSMAQMLAFTFLGQAHMANFLVMTGGPLVWLWRERRVIRRQADPSDGGTPAPVEVPS